LASTRWSSASQSAKPSRTLSIAWRSRASAWRARVSLSRSALDAAAFAELGLQAVLQLVQLGATLYELLRQVGLGHLHPTRGRIGRVGRRFRRRALHHVGLAKYSTGR
jgi:hypothetical protein